MYSPASPPFFSGCIGQIATLVGVYYYAVIAQAISIPFGRHKPRDQPRVSTGQEALDWVARWRAMPLGVGLSTRCGYGLTSCWCALVTGELHVTLAYLQVPWTGLVTAFACPLLTKLVARARVETA